MQLYFYNSKKQNSIKDIDILKKRSIITSCKAKGLWIFPKPLFLVRKPLQELSDKYMHTLCALCPCAAWHKVFIT